MGIYLNISTTTKHLQMKQNIYPAFGTEPAFFAFTKSNKVDIAQNALVDL